MTYAVNCKKGGFVTIRYNNDSDFEAELAKVHADVETEPQLQPKADEVIKGLQGGDNARPVV